MTNLERVTSTMNTAEVLARKVWLASLGAYGKGFEEIKGQYEKVNIETSRLFEELVAKGEKLQADTTQIVKEKTDVQTRVQEVRQKLGLDSSDIDLKIEALSQKVDELAQAVNKLN